MIRQTAILTGNVTTASDTITDVTGLLFAIAANEVWEFEFHLKTGCDNTGGINFAINGPSGATTVFSLVGSTSGVTAFGADSSSSLNTLQTVSDFNTVNASTGVVKIVGQLTASSTPGSGQLRFASVTNTQTSTIFAGSYMSARRLL